MYIFKKIDGKLRFDRVVPHPDQLRKEFLDALGMVEGDLMYVRRDEWWVKRDVGFSNVRGIPSEELTRLYLCGVAYEWKLLGKLLIRRDNLTVSRPVTVAEYEAAAPGFFEYLAEDGSWKRA